MTYTVISWLLVVLVVTDWWAVLKCRAFMRDNPEVTQFRGQYWRLILEATAGTAGGVLGAAFLLGHQIPGPTGVAILVVALVATGGPGIVFLLDVYFGITEWFRRPRN